MESISIPISVLQELNSNCNNKNCRFEPRCILLYYHHSPLSTTSSYAANASYANYHYDNHINQKSLFIILDNTIPFWEDMANSSNSIKSLTFNKTTDSCIFDVPTCTTSTSSTKQQQQQDDGEVVDLPVVQLHPLLEQFMIVSANNILICNNHNHTEQNDNPSSSSQSSKSSICTTDDSKAIPVSLQFIHPPNFYKCNNNHDERYNNNNYDHDHELLNCTISKQKFYLQSIPSTSIHHLINTNNTRTTTGTGGGVIHNNIQMTLEFIYCSNELYEQYFVQMGNMNMMKTNMNYIYHHCTNQENNQHATTSSSTTTKTTTTAQNQKMFQYLYQTLCQAFEYKIVKEDMIVPIILPALPQHLSSSNNINDIIIHNEKEDGTNDIVAFFKLQKLVIQQQQIDQSSAMVLQDDNKNEFYRIGSTIPSNQLEYDDDDDERCNNTSSMNQISIQITLPPCYEHRNNDNIDTSSHDCNSNKMIMNDATRTSSTCPGYEKLVNDVVSMANIKVESGAPTGILLTGCSGVGKTALVCTK